MTPAERLAALKALRHGIDQALGQAEDAVRSTMLDTGADRFRTPLGSVSLAERAGSITFDEDRLLAFAEEADLDGVETIKQVRPTFRRLFDASGEQVIFKPTGEVIDFATVRPGTQYLTTRLNDEAKDAAEKLLGDRFLTIAELIDETTQLEQ